MARKYALTLRHLNFSSVNDSEQRTALHSSIFTGHERYFYLVIENTELEIIWRKGIENTFRYHSDSPPTLDTKELINYLKVYRFSQLIEIGLIDPEIEFFCLSLEKLTFNVSYTIPIPKTIEQLFHLRSHG